MPIHKNQLEQQLPCVACQRLIATLSDCVLGGAIEVRLEQGKNVWKHLDLSTVPRATN